MDFLIIIPIGDNPIGISFRNMGKMNINIIKK
nr:MAG TPA: hypothetical protein [Caudoviricetes sp.]